MDRLYHNIRQGRFSDHVSIACRRLGKGLGLNCTPFKVFVGCARYTKARYSAGNGYLLQMAHLSVIERP